LACRPTLSRIFEGISLEVAEQNGVDDGLLLLHFHIFILKAKEIVGLLSPKIVINQLLFDLKLVAFTLYT
jgi:hypothetical protein